MSALPNQEDVIARRFWSGPLHRFIATENLSGFYRRRAHLIAKMLAELPRRLPVLDVGCGSGFLAAELTVRGHRVVGLDLSPDQIESTAQRCAGLSVDLRVGGIEVLSANERFEAVCAIGVLPYLADPHSFVTSLCDRVAPDGLLIVSITRSATPFVALELLRHLGRFRPTAVWWLIAANLVRTGIWSGGFVPPEQQRQTNAEKLTRGLAAAGLEPVARLGLFNIEMLDAAPGPVGVLVARAGSRFGWSIVLTYRR